VTRQRWDPLLVFGVACLVLGAAPVLKVPYVERLQPPGTADVLVQPLSVHADPHTAETFVCDRSNHRVVIFDGKGLKRYSMPGGSTFRTPLDMAVDAEGYIFLLAYFQRQRGLVELDFDGKLVRDVTLEDLPEDAEPPHLVSLALSPVGDRLYLLDQANLRLWIASRAGRVLGSVDLGAGLTEKDAQETILGHVDAYGDLVLVAVPTEGKVHLLERDGQRRGAVGIRGTGPCQTAFPVAAALDEAGNVVVLDRRRALGMVWRPEGNRCLGEFSAIGTSPGALYQPADMSLGPKGRLYISQGFEGRVQVFSYAPPGTER
jgi:hypothetical protein